MKVSTSRRSVFCASIAAALLAACGGGSRPPIDALGVIPQSRAVATDASRGGSWMLPEAKSEDLLYVSDFYGVHVFSYPNGVHVGDLYGFVSPAGLCSDNAGDVFVTDTPAYHVYEYAHGGTEPLKTLYDNYVDFGPFDCSVDPATGNLAATDLDGEDVVIFPKANERPKVYYEDMRYTYMFNCAYDNKGDLFVDDVFNRNHRLKYIGELPRSAKQFTNYLLDRRIAHPGGIQFDGKHIVIEDLGSLIAYRLRFSGSNAIIVGNTQLNGAGYVDQYSIQGNTLIGPDSNTTVYLWKYPKGGSPVSSIGGFTLNYGSTVSVSPKSSPSAAPRGASRESAR